MEKVTVEINLPVDGVTEKADFYENAILASAGL